MEESIGVSVERIRVIIASVTTDEFSTGDIVRGYFGIFCSNLNTPAYYSLNAQFGKLLKRNQALLGITEVNSNCEVEDDRGHRTTTSIWRAEA